MRAIGLMSGTSLDGIDVAHVEVVRLGGRIDVRLLDFITVPFAPELRARLLSCLPPRDVGVAALAELNAALGEAFASAVLRAARERRIELAEVDVIGSHGQTIYHAPAAGVTLQIGEAAIIAARTGVTCVADFRPADMANGGQGAPLVPFVDHLLFARGDEFRAAINIGGIANITLLPPGGDPDDVRAFDCGPGNMVIDECVRIATAGAMQRDEGGAMAARGRVDRDLLAALLADPYFAAAPPKSTGRERFGAAYALALWDRAMGLGLAADDAIATATALTAATVAASVPAGCARVIVSGGGAHNRALLDMLRSELRAAGTTALVEPSDAHGVAADAKEALAFAVLACEAVAGRVNHLRRCTGAAADAILGKIVPGANFAALMNRAWTGGERLP